MNYSVTRNSEYDFKNESSGSVYPNLHKYPATMLVQIGMKILKELDIKKGVLLDPYCGFEGNGFRHILTYERILGKKRMPLENSPTNEKNKTSKTMQEEYIVVCERF